MRCGCAHRNLCLQCAIFYRVFVLARLAVQNSYDAARGFEPTAEPYLRVCLRDRRTGACGLCVHGGYPIVVPPTGLPIRDDCIEVDSDIAMEPGMVVNLETPLFLPTAGALQIEKTFVVTEDGNRDHCQQDRTRPHVMEGSETPLSKRHFENSERTLHGQA